MYKCGSSTNGTVEANSSGVNILKEICHLRISLRYRAAESPSRAPTRHESSPT
jgi:hypothetical protein